MVKNLFLESIVFFRYIKKKKNVFIEELWWWILLLFPQRLQLNPLHQWGLVDPADVNNSHSQK